MAIKTITHINTTREKGKNPCHVNPINWSYRIRGKVPRIQIKLKLKNTTKKIKKTKFLTERKITTIINLINKIFIYSAINKKANLPPLYSVLNPDTSSDSPSAKSKGVRLVSAKAVTNQINPLKGTKKIKGTASILTKETIFNLIISIKGEIKIKIILTSYEIDWAIPRKAPNNAYFELEAHPAPKITYTPIPEIIKKNSIPKVKWIPEYSCGNKCHKIKALLNLKIGAKKKGNTLANLGTETSLQNNLIASAKGWGSPINLTLFGPFRNWK